MVVQFNKKVTNVDFGLFGKKNLQVDVRLKKNKDVWEFYCHYVYIVNNDGTQSPVQDNIISDEFLAKVLSECLEEVKTITSWE